MARYHGKRGKVFLAATAGGTAIPVASMATWNLSAKSDRADATSFGDGNKVRVVGLPDYSGKFDGFFDDTDSTVFLGSETLAGVPCYLYPDFTNAPSRYWYGLANVDYDITAAVGDAVKISANWDAAGTWGRK
jgi:hypothetical protein